MQKLFTVIFSVIALGFTALANATLIPLEDGGSTLFKKGDQIVFVDELTLQNPLLTYRVTPEGPDDWFEWVLTALPDIDLLAILTTEPNGAGFILALPDDLPIIKAGETFSFLIDDFINQIGKEPWITFGFDLTDPAVLAQLENGLMLPALTILKNMPIAYGSGIEIGGGGDDNGGGGNKIPLPNTVFLMSLGLISVLASQRRKYKTQPITA